MKEKSTNTHELEAEKSKLMASAAQLEKQIAETKEKCLKEICRLPEAQAVKKLCQFRQKWEMNLPIMVKCNFVYPPFSQEFDRGGADGDMNVSCQNQHAFIARFFADDNIGNVSMEDDMHRVSPLIHAQFQQLRKAEKVLKAKATKIAEKYGLTWQDIGDDLAYRFPWKRGILWRIYGKS